MSFHLQNVVIKVRRERIKGASLREIEKKFGIPNTTVSRWVRDLTSKTTQSSLRKQQSAKEQFHGIAGTFRIDKNAAKILASYLYWCEGSKYPSTSCVAFSNSDWSLVKTFLALLRRGFLVREEKIRIHLQLHARHSIKEVTRFWSHLLQVPIGQFYPPTVTKPTLKMKRLDYRGTCTIKYFDVKLQLSIIGIYEKMYEKNFC